MSRSCIGNFKFKQENYIKENLPKNQVYILMDFAEDYRCRSQKKIQSTYWSPTQVTMHLVVMYYKKLSKNLNHQNFVFISNKSRHGVTFVFTLIVKLILLLREIVPDLEMIHSTDSPVNIEAKLLPR